MRVILTENMFLTLSAWAVLVFCVHSATLMSLCLLFLVHRLCSTSCFLVLDLDVSSLCCFSIAWTLFIWTCFRPVYLSSTHASCLSLSFVTEYLTYHHGCSSMTAPHQTHHAGIQLHGNFPNTGLCQLQHPADVAETFLLGTSCSAIYIMKTCWSPRKRN